MSNGTVTINAEYLIALFEGIGKVLKDNNTDMMLMKYRLDDLEKKVENAEKDINVTKGEHYGNVI